MQPLAPTLQSLEFLANPNKTETVPVIRFHAFTACFERVGKEGQLAVTQPVEYTSYQEEKTLYYHERAMLTDFSVGSNALWNGNAHAIFRAPFTFERRIVHRDVQIIVRIEGSEAQRIEELVLPKDFYRPRCECRPEAPHSTTCAFTQNFAKVDLCTAVNTTTGKLHLLVLAPVNDATFTVTSYSASP